MSAGVTRAFSYADDALFPFIRLRWPAHPIPDASLERTYRDLEAMCRRGEHVVLVTFDDMHPHFTAKQRQFITKFISSEHRMLTKNCRGLAIVSLEGDARGLVTALDWQSKSPFERGMFHTRREAIDWLGHRWRTLVGTPLSFSGAES